MAGRSVHSTLLLTFLTLLAFAGNSILCRLALVEATIGPIEFTAIRIGSGALVLLPFLGRRGEDAHTIREHGRSAIALIGYALCFSLAYVTLDAGVGALLLFGAVQVTMIGVGWLRGERLSVIQWAGLTTAIVGFVLLVAPGIRAPDPVGAILMTVAGVAWGAYTLLGRGVPSPTRATAANFLIASPIAIALLLIAGSATETTARGLSLAIASGALTSGIGYVIWYAALRGHTATSAAVVQLAVPVIAALGGVALLGEQWTARLLLASLLTLGGVAVATFGSRRA